MQPKNMTRLVVAVFLACTVSSEPTVAKSGDYYANWGFFSSGIALVPFDAGGDLADLAADSIVVEDGSMFIAGTATGLQGERRIGIAKLNPAGQADLTFNMDGQNMSALKNVFGTSLAVSADWIYVAGFTVDDPATQSVETQDMVVCRFSRDDGTSINFADTGTPCVFPDSIPGTEDQATAIVLQDDGKFVIAGTMEAGLGEVAVFARFHEGGARDTSFGTNEGTNLLFVRNTDLYSEHHVEALIQTSSDTFAAVGSTRLIGDDSKSALVIRFDANGNTPTEAAFRRDGSNTRDTVLRDVVAVESDDDALVVVGHVELSEGQSSGFLAKVAAGSSVLVAEFGQNDPDYTSITLPDNQNLSLEDVALEPNGGIVAQGVRFSGQQGFVNDVYRFDADGFVDASFGDAGHLTIDLELPGKFQGAAGLTVRNDALFVGGYAFLSPGANVDFFAAKLTAGTGFRDSFED